MSVSSAAVASPTARSTALTGLVWPAFLRDAPRRLALVRAATRDAGGAGRA